mgnify:CR=1 FL=1
MQTKIEILRAILDSGLFHHATYRDIGTCWEGLWIYQKDEALRGFVPVLSFGKNDPELNVAHDLVRHTGVSVGSFGGG